MKARKLFGFRALTAGFALALGMTQAQADCWERSGAKYGVEPQLLQAIALVESEGRPDAVHRNNDGSQDFGLMQINSIHLPDLRKQGITEHRLLSEPCLSIDVGASILAGFIARHGYNWTAVGAYNAGNSASREHLRMRYARKVWRRYLELVAGPPQSA